MEWNAEAQLTRVLLNSNEVARFAYDPRGRRVEKVSGAITTSYTYDGEDLLREIRGATAFKYVPGPGTDEPLAQQNGAGVLTFFHADALGSIVRRTSQGGDVVHEYRYDAWGNVEAGSNEPGYSFTGREWDPGIGLYYYRARYYDASTSRFLSEDPSRMIDGPNLYAYVRNRPSDRVDPFGLQSMPSLTCPWNTTRAEGHVCCDGNGGYIPCYSQSLGDFLDKHADVKACFDAHEHFHMSRMNMCTPCSLPKCTIVGFGSPEDVQKEECWAYWLSFRCRNSVKDPTLRNWLEKETRNGAERWNCQTKNEPWTPAGPPPAGP